MSADNWGICPKCKVEYEKRRDKLHRDAEIAYGKVGPDEYLALLEKANAPVDQDYHLREDYEIGIDADGEFCVSYGACCQACDFRFEFDHKEQAYRGDSNA